MATNIYRWGELDISIGHGLKDLNKITLFSQLDENDNENDGVPCMVLHASHLNLIGDQCKYLFRAQFRDGLPVSYDRINLMVGLQPSITDSQSNRMAEMITVDRKSVV